MLSSLVRAILRALIAVLAVAACAGKAAPPPDAAPGGDGDAGLAGRAAVPIGGTVRGLVGALELLNDGRDPLVVTRDGPFVFPAPVARGDRYAVTVARAPSSQVCGVARAAGVANEAVADVEVACVANDAALASLVIATAGGPVLTTEPFLPGNVAYVARLTSLFDGAEVTITATAADPDASVAVDGVVAVSGQPSHLLVVPPGRRSVSIVVTSRAMTAQRVYTVALERAVSVKRDYLKASNAGAGDTFGAAVAVSGDTVAVGAPNEQSNAAGVGGDQASNALDLSGAVYVYRRAGASWAQEAYLKASNPGLEDGFGEAVALSGDTLAVGAPFEDSGGLGIGGTQASEAAPSSGAVYVYRRAGASWAQEAYVKASTASGRFGRALAMSGDTLLVGAPAESSHAGAAYVFVRAGGGWSQQARLVASNGELGDGFGSAVAIDGDTIVVGASGERSASRGVNGDPSDNGAESAGAAYVFARTGTSWTQQAYLKASDAARGQMFGTSVAVSGDLVLASAPWAADYAGEVHGFVRGQGGWSILPPLLAPNARSSAHFGIRVAASGDRVLVAATGEAGSSAGIDGDMRSVSAPGAGAVYVMRRAGQRFVHQAYVKAITPGAGDDFGAGLAVAGDTVVIGAPLEDSSATGVNGNEASNAASAAGAAYVVR